MRKLKIMENVICPKLQLVSAKLELRSQNYKLFSLMPPFTREMKLLLEELMLISDRSVRDDEK